MWLHQGQQLSPSGGMLIIGETLHGGGAAGIWKISVPSSHLAVNLKLL